ncbi:PLC-like phosphodiesterase [Dendrothele bispora CBS 962.96]|uniref:PLC-like phosphodiesterase n=1 Tax=Dendrothele bispora (strain CBS 962.96) TaxID=1314807 RepID=A0A4S8M9Q2_DENBC|nr:PLC-like phosphodiesterase [Dendrothele bispora CBS 962.96]
MFKPQLLHCLSSLVLATLSVAASSQSYLAQSALTEILNRGAPILGFDTGCAIEHPTCDWMAKLPSDTKLVHMNLPGTHDTATWNYTQETQDALLGYTGVIPEAKFFQCQEHSIFQMLNEGIRVFDLRFAWNPGNQTIGFHHAQALLAPTTRMEDVFFGLYSWLDKHPSETILVSLNHESGTGTPNNPELQEHLYGIFNSDLGKKYWLQTNGTLGTLGESRGKLILLQRFNYDMLPPSLSNRIGIQLPPDQWTDNGPNITILYNQAEAQFAFIEDYYEIGLPSGSGVALNVQWKLNATLAHLQDATTLNPDQLYISFASSEHNSDVPPEYPRIMALGNGTVPGVNQQMLPWLKERKGQRFGIVMLDFYDSVPGLVEAVIGL